MAIDGLDRLKRKLTDLPAATRAGIITAMELAADDVVSLAKSLVPAKTGALKASIGWTWGAPPKGALTIAKSRPVRNGNMRITVYAGNDKAFYARWVEFGTAPHPQGGSHKGTQHPGTRARPFFYPAFRATKKRAKSRISRAITKAAKQVASS